MSLFKTKASKPSTTPRRKSITLTEEQLVKYDELKRLFLEITIKARSNPPTDADLFKLILDGSLDDLIAEAKEELFKAVAPVKAPVKAKKK